MAKSNVSKKEESNQDKSETVEKFEGDMEKMSKMKFVDFGKETVQYIKTIQETMIESIGWYAKDRDGFPIVIYEFISPVFYMSSDSFNIIVTHTRYRPSNSVGYGIITN